MNAQTNPLPPVLKVVPPSSLTFKDINLKTTPEDTPESILAKAIQRMISGKINCAKVWTRIPIVGRTTTLNAHQGGGGRGKANSPSGMFIVWSANLEKEGYKINPDHVVKAARKQEDFLLIRLAPLTAFNRLS